MGRMFLRTMGLLLVVSGLWLLPRAAYALTPEEELAILKSQMNEMMARMTNLEKELAASKKTGEEQQKQMAAKEEEAKKQTASKVDLAKLTSKLKMSGRWAAGYYWSQVDGLNQGGNFLAPEAKIRFDFAPDDFDTIVMRLNLNNAIFNSLDYFYLDNKYINQFLKNKLPITTNIRIGRYKIDFGEETWSNNTVESILPSNTAANVAGSDEGMELRLNVGEKNPVLFSASVSNGNTGTTDNNGAKAISAKIAYRVVDPLYLSASYYHSGGLRNATSEMSIGGLATPPTGAGDWTRQLWEVDARYDIGKGKIIDPPAYTDSKVYIKGGYGQYRDDAKAPGVDRRGRYGYLESLWNALPKLYVAGRYSLLNTFDGKMLSWNSITCNKYGRWQIGGGVRVTKATLVKAEYVRNKEEGTVNGDEPEDDAVNLTVSSSF